MVDEGLKTEIFQDLGQDQPRSEEDQEIRRKDIAYSRMVKKAVHDDKFKHLPDDERSRKLDEAVAEYPEVIASGRAISDWIEPGEFIAARIMYEENVSKEEARERAKQILVDTEPRRLNKRINMGLEIELGRPRSMSSSRETLLEYAKTVDNVQELGAMVDNDSFREVKLPKSVGTHDQVRAAYELERLGVITKDQKVGIHFNISGFTNPKDHLDDFVVAHLMFSATAHFGDPRIMFGNSINLPKHSQKPIFEEDPDLLPKIIPIRIREGGVVEFRGVFKKWKGSPAFARSVETFGSTLDVLSDYTEQKAKGISEDKMTGGAKMWLELKGNFFKTISDAAEKNKLPQLKNIEQYVSDINYFLNLKRTQDKSNQEIVDLMKHERNYKNLIQKNEYINATENLKNLAIHVIKKEKDNDKFWEIYEKEELEFLNPELHEKRIAAIKDLREKVKNNEEIPKFSWESSNRFSTISRALTYQNLTQFGSIWADSISLLRLQDVRQPLANKLIEARKLVRQRGTNSIDGQLLDLPKAA